MMDNLISHPNAPQAVEAIEALGTLDDAFLQKARLGIMSTLLALGEADFKLLKEALSLSDGNLSTHLAVLEERGYVAIRKEFGRRKPHTTYSPTKPDARRSSAICRRWSASSGPQTPPIEPITRVRSHTPAMAPKALPQRRLRSADPH